MLDLQKAGMSPSALANRPALEERLHFYSSAFDRLSNSRQWNKQFPQAITISEILSYCQLRFIMDIELRQRLLTYVQKLDDVWVELKIKAMDTGSKS